MNTVNLLQSNTFGRWTLTQTEQEHFDVSQVKGR